MKRFLIIFSMMILIVTMIYYYMRSPEETDVLVIGAGAAGMTAAIEAYDNGASVIIIEKMPFAGGNTIRAYSGINGWNTAFQLENGIHDDPNVYYSDTLNAGHFMNDSSLVSILVKNSESAIRWLTSLGIDLSEVGILAGHSIARTHRPAEGYPIGAQITEVLENQIKSRNIDLRFEHQAIQLTHTNRVTGVLVRNETGREYTIRCRNIIIATGGFGGSPEFFVQYNPRLSGYNTTNHAGATGDGIRMAAEIGADLVDMSKIQIHPTVEPYFGVLIPESVRGNGGILINRYGRRFTNELTNRDVLSGAILKQDEEFAYLVFDEKIRQSLSADEGYVSMHLMYAEENLEKLAEKLKIDYGVLMTSLNKYNRAVETGTDLSYHRTNLPMKIDTPPFYGVKIAPAVHYCMGGIKIDKYGRVISTEGEVIPGLFAAGEVTGGIHGANRLGGNSLADTIVFGRIAGQSASGIKP